MRDKETNNKLRSRRRRRSKPPMPSSNWFVSPTHTNTHTPAKSVPLSYWWWCCHCCLSMAMELVFCYPTTLTKNLFNFAKFFLGPGRWWLEFSQERRRKSISTTEKATKAGNQGKNISKEQLNFNAFTLYLRGAAATLTPKTTTLRFQMGHQKKKRKTYKMGKDRQAKDKVGWLLGWLAGW